MKTIVVNKLVMFIENNSPSYSKTDLEKIKYGLEATYLTIVKAIIFMIVCFFLGLLKEFVFLTIIFSGIRLFAFGLHAPNSFVCLILSGFVFIFASYLSTFMIIETPIKIIFFVICIILLLLYAPADTHKRPLIHKKKRRIYKILSFFVSIVYCFISLVTKNNFLSNCLLFSVIIEILLIMPISYKLLNLPYNNYKKYKRGNRE